MSKHVYIIAEAGVNHDGSPDDALRLVDAAADAGADCVKFQTFRADALATTRAPKASYQQRTTDAAQPQQDMLRQLELPPRAYHALMAQARKRGIDFLSTPFDAQSLDFLVRELKLRRIKIGSGDLTNAPMLLEAASAGRAVILSTGMATLAEVRDALAALAFGYARRTEPPSAGAFAAAWAKAAVRAALRGKVTLLHCTTEYPAPAQSVNLKAMDTLAQSFALPVGYSDHTLGIEIAIAAAARGAVMIEKHLTLDPGRQGPDHAASLSPETFRKMVEAVRLVEAALGDGRKRPQPAEIKNIPVARKALVAGKPIAKGEILTAENIAIKRPAVGLAPANLWSLMGTPAKRNYAVDDALDR
jgi:N-acetylneuraminate synthase